MSEMIPKRIFEGTKATGAMRRRGKPDVEWEPNYNFVEVKYRI